MSSNKKPVFVTGGSGLVGAALLRQLLKNNTPVKALYHTSRSPLLTPEEENAIEWIQGDILDTSLLLDILPSCSSVYHCAAIVSFHPAQRERMYKINVEGTANIVNACLETNIEKLIHVSSVAALGNAANDAPVNETNEWSEENPGSQYGRTKYLAEMEVWRGIGEGLCAAIINPSIILGEGNWHQGSAALFKKVWNAFPFYTTGSTGFVDASDVAKAMIMLMESPLENERYILTADHLSYEALMNGIAARFQKRPPRYKAPSLLLELAWRWEAMKALFSKAEPLITKETVQKAYQHSRYENKKILQDLPAFSYTPIESTLNRTCSWFMAKEKRD
jgi:nucleoside-diphosphate-sugar epimerase